MKRIWWTDEHETWNVSVVFPYISWDKYHQTSDFILININNNSLLFSDPRTFIQLATVESTTLRKHVHISSVRWDNFSEVLA